MVVCAAPVFFALYHDIGRDYLWAPDRDISSLYNALLLNGGLPNEIPGYNGFGLFFLLGHWFGLLKFLGIVDVATIAGLPAPPASEAVLQYLMVWARILTIILTCVLIVSLLFITEAITGSRYFAFLAALAFSFTQSINSLVLLLKPELTSAVFAYLAILFVILAVKVESAPERALTCIALSAFCALFSMYSKTASLPLVLLLPLFPLVFGYRWAHRPDGVHISTVTTWAFVLLAAIFGYLAIPPFLESMISRAYVYNGLIVFYIFLCVVIYAKQRGLSYKSVITGCAAVTLGLAAAQYLLMIDAHEINTVTIANHLDYLTHKGTSPVEGWIDLRRVPGSKFDPGDFIAPLFANVEAILTDSLFNFVWNCRGSSFLFDVIFNFCWLGRRMSLIYLAGLIALVYLLATSRREVAVQVLFLMLAVAFVEMIQRLHYFNQFYKMYVEGMLLAAAAFYVCRISSMVSVRIKYVLSAASLFVVLSISQIEARHMLLPTFAIRWGDICTHRVYAKRISHHFDRYCRPPDTPSQTRK